MADDKLGATKVIDAPAEAIFAVLADPAKHAAIDGTGWVSDTVDSTPLTAAGQVFRMSMYHPNHPDGNYQTANRVRVFEPPSTICWEPGYDTEDGTLGFGGWTWRYDLKPIGPSSTAPSSTGRPSTAVTLTYDWSAVPDDIRERIGFPPFPPEHLSSSLAHLAELVTDGR